LLTLKLGPFVDTGAIADSSGRFGSQRWLWDTGAQCKVRLLGTVTVVLSYGRDLRAAATFSTELRFTETRPSPTPLFFSNDLKLRDLRCATAAQRGGNKP
jgi:hypothetical protein